MSADFSTENKLWRAGINYVVGIDEVGRGPWAGPVVAAAVIFPAYVQLPQLPNDSKKLSEKQRYVLRNIIENNALSIGIGEVPALEIDEIGISPATQKAMQLALNNLTHTPDHYLIDAFMLKNIPSDRQSAIIKGDSISSTIAAASIIAKTYRDELMINYSKKNEYEMYGFEKHKGYGTALHKDAILANGLSDLHRKTFIHF